MTQLVHSPQRNPGSYEAVRLAMTVVIGHAGRKPATRTSSHGFILLRKMSTTAARECTYERRTMEAGISVDHQPDCTPMLQLSMFESAPAPSVFVRRPVKRAVNLAVNRDRNALNHDRDACFHAEQPFSVEIGGDVWEFAISTNRRRCFDAEFYAAQRQYVGQEVESSLVAEEDGTEWDEEIVELFFSSTERLSKIDA
jgi:hypothetical protein